MYEWVVRVYDVTTDKHSTFTFLANEAEEAKEYCDKLLFSMRFYRAYVEVVWDKKFGSESDPDFIIPPNLCEVHS